ncbi:MAG: hypothetical protein MAGBODY4_01372 [Candidatus Marinimicrobia bacterium]|nr:hypothetical protein [Candidatus Neomarinimicrobiota bacterium]
MIKYSRKNTIVAAFLVVLVAIPIYASGIIKNFTGVSLEDKVVLVWETTDEQGLDHFRVERSTDGDMFFMLGVVQCNNESSSYEYVDESVFAKPTGDASGDRVYIYRLKLVYKDGHSEYTDPIQVTPRISSTRHTWGSIKAMFK